MTRDQVPPRARKVLEILEEAKNFSAQRTNGPWVHTMELVKEIGINFKVGLIKLQHKKKPWLGLGFVIDRKPIEGPENYWLYRLASYPGGFGTPHDYDFKHLKQESLFTEAS